MCVKRVDGGKKAQPPVVTGDVDMNEDMAPETSEEQQQSTEKWSLYCSLSPLGEKLLSISVSFPQKYYDISGRIHACCKKSCTEKIDVHTTVRVLILFVQKNGLDL